MSYLSDQLDLRDCCWETRKPGEELRDDWYAHPTLRLAVKAAFGVHDLPSGDWQQLLGDDWWAKLAFLGMQAGLILSTGVTVAEMFGEEEDDD